MGAKDRISELGEKIREWLGALDEALRPAPAPVPVRVPVRRDEPRPRR